MSKPDPILEPEDALALWRWAWAVHEGPRDEHERSHEQTDTGLLDVLTLAACELSLAGHHEWIARLPEMLRVHRSWLMYDGSAQHRCLQAVADLLHRGPTITRAIRAMARDHDSQVRAAVASGLRPADPEARALLETLAADPDRRVRSLAHERLPTSEPAPWWIGKFDSDPVARLPRADDTVLAALRTVALFADRNTRAQRRMLPDLVEALAELPTPILFEFVRRFVTFERLGHGIAPMLDELLRRPQGDRALWDMLLLRLNRPHEWTHHCFMLGRLWNGLGEEARERLRVGLPQRRQEYGNGTHAEDMDNLVEGLLHGR